jgi:two-component system chemotaxis sensor kinase CheA
MDVVRTSLQSLGGRVSIASEPGKGSVFTLSLPLTLAVLDGMLVSVAGQTYIIPLAAIAETIRISAENLRPLGASDHVIRVRNSLTPLLDLGAVLGLRAKSVQAGSGVVILVESTEGQTSSLLVDEIRDQRQIVVKSLESNYTRIPGIAAATILGDGNVALILDIDDLLATNSSRKLAEVA